MVAVVGTQTSFGCVSAARKVREMEITQLDGHVNKLIGSLVNEYVRAVDGRQLENWINLFDEDCSYSVVTRENYDQGLPLALILDDSKDRVKDRVTYITTVWAGHYNDYYPRHIVSNVNVAPSTSSDEEFDVTANFAVYITEAEGFSRLLAVGEYLDIVKVTDDVAKFKEKKVILDTGVLPRYFVYPL